MPNMEAIYFITPSEESISTLIQDFKSRSLYKAVHVYVTEAIPEQLFQRLSKSEVVKKMKSLVEVNISFTAYESKVYTLDVEPSISMVYSYERYLSNLLINDKIASLLTKKQFNIFIVSSSGLLERMAEQLATLCSTLGEFPSIRYRA